MDIYNPFTLVKAHFTHLCKCIICAYFSEAGESTVSLVLGKDDFY